MNSLFSTYSDHSSFEKVQVNSKAKKLSSKSVCICRNYFLAVLGVVIGSSIIADVYLNPATQAQQDKIKGYAPYATVALIFRNCPACLIPNGEAQRR